MMNVSSAIFSAWRNLVTRICFIHLHVRWHFIKLPLLPSLTWQQNVTKCCWEGSASTAIPPTSASDAAGQHNKMGGTTFGAEFVFHITYATTLV